MRKTLSTLSLAAILASGQVWADDQTLAAVQGALPAGMTLSEAAAQALQAATTEEAIAQAVADVVAALGDDAAAISAVVSAAVSQNPSMAPAIAKAATKAAPEGAEVIKQAAINAMSLAVAVPRAQDINSIEDAVDEALVEVAASESGDTGGTTTTDTNSLPGDTGTGGSSSSPS